MPKDALDHDHGHVCLSQDRGSKMPYGMTTKRLNLGYMANVLWEVSVFGEGLPDKTTTVLDEHPFIAGCLPMGEKGVEQLVHHGNPFFLHGPILALTRGQAHLAP